MKPKFQREELADGIVCYLGDCRDILPTLGKVDAVVTDPPYGIGFKYESYEDDPAKHANKCQEWLTYMKMITTGPICVFCGMRQIWAWPPAYWILSWRKTFSVSRSPFGSNNWEPIIVYQKGRKGERASDSFEATFINDADAAKHPCPKPVEAIAGVLRLVSVVHEIICDPFMGSGTTGVACVNLQRKFIGIEIEPKYFDIACKRIEKALKAPDLFVKKPKLKQNSFFPKGRTK